MGSSKIKRISNSAHGHSNVCRSIDVRFFCAEDTDYASSQCCKTINKILQDKNMTYQEAMYEGFIFEMKRKLTEMSKPYERELFYYSCIHFELFGTNNPVCSKVIPACCVCTPVFGACHV